MEEWQNKPAEDYIKIFNQLKVTYREVRGKIRFPITISELEGVYTVRVNSRSKESTPPSSTRGHFDHTPNNRL